MFVSMLAFLIFVLFFYRAHSVFLDCGVNVLMGEDETIEVYHESVYLYDWTITGLRDLHFHRSNCSRIFVLDSELKLFEFNETSSRWQLTQT